MPRTQLALSTTQVGQFFESPVWQEIERRLASRLQQVDSEIEHSDPFIHGMAVGSRREIRAFLGYRARFLEELGVK